MSISWSSISLVIIGSMKRKTKVKEYRAAKKPKIPEPYAALMKIAGLKEINAVSEILIALERKIMQLPFSECIAEAMEKTAIESKEAVEWERSISGEYYYYKGNFVFRSYYKLAVIILKHFGKISLAGKIAYKDKVIEYLEKKIREMNIEKYNFEAKLKKKPNSEYYRKKIGALEYLINEYDQALKWLKE
jgi:hypothetical protein